MLQTAEIIPPPSDEDIDISLLSQRELQALLALGKQLVSILDLDEVYALVAESARQVVDAETLAIPMINPADHSYTYVAATGKNGEMIRNHQFPITLGACGWVLRNERPLLFGIGHPLDITSGTIIDWEQGMESQLLVPLVCRGHIIGGLSALGKRGGASFTERDAQILTLFAYKASIALDNARIFRELHAEKEKAQITLNAIADGVLTTDIDGRIDYLNGVMSELFQVPDRETIGKTLRDVVQLVDEMSGHLLEDPVARCLATQAPLAMQHNVLLINPEGRKIAIECLASPLHDAHRTITGVVLVIHDVSEPRRLQQELMHQANYDMLTGLGNRRQFSMRLEEAIRTAREQQRNHALLYMDLDQFKLINDTCGHLAGDAFLTDLSDHMHRKVRRSDLLARLGGDEFGLLLFDCPEDEALRVAQEMIETIRGYRFTHSNRMFEVGVSIGLVPITQVVSQVEEVMSTADIACYAAKEQGGNRVHIYAQGNDDLQRRHGEMQWVPRLRSALAEDRFELYLQLIAPLHAESSLKPHYEVLLRMRDEQGNLVMPGHFIPAAERYKLMSELDRWVVDHALEKLRTCHVDQYCAHHVSINLSGASVSNEAFREELLGRLAELRLPPGSLCFEMTETCAVENLRDVAHFITQLAELGCETSLDDFGSGLCSFGYLKELPVTYLKIDGKLVRGVGANPLDLGMVEAINRIGHLLGKQTIAEWVEDEATRDRLRDIGVDFGQGWLFGKPIPWDDLYKTTD